MGGLGDLAGLPRRHPQRFDGRPDPGEPMLEVQGVGQQLEPGQGGDPESGGERFGRERRHQRRPLPTQGFVGRVEAGEAGVGPGHKPRLGSGRVQHTPLGRDPELGSAGLRSRTSASRRGRAATPRRGSVTSTGVPFNIVSNMSQSNQQAPTFRPGIEAETRGCGEVFSWLLLHALLGLRFQTNPLWCALAFGYACVDGVADPARFHSRRLTLLCVKAGRVGSFAARRSAYDLAGPARVRRHVASRPPPLRSSGQLPTSRRYPTASGAIMGGMGAHRPGTA